MKIYGVGIFKYPNTGRIVHDFEDGPFSTFNPVLIRIARRQGFSIGKPIENRATGPDTTGPVSALVGKSIKTVDELMASLNAYKPDPEAKVVRVKRKYTKRVKNES